jgi:cytochrome c556
MTSLKLHGAHEVAGFMPEGMQAIGTEMHHAASRFAVVAKDAAVTGDVKPVLTQLGHVTRQCVACHSSYRLQ